jgi:hypothetical protein
VGYYPGSYAIDYWALFTHENNHDVPGIDAQKIVTAYMCLNRKLHWHRQRFYQQLVDLDVVDQGLVSYGVHRSLPVDCEHDTFAPEATRDKFGVPNDIASLGHSDNWSRCFLNVVTETAWNINHTGFVSEKIYKPIVGCRPFLVYDPDGATEWLTTRGFEVYTKDFSDVTDLDLSLPHNISPFLKTLCAQTATYWQAKYVALKHKIMYNKTHFTEYVKKQKLIVKKGIQCQI